MELFDLISYHMKIENTNQLTTRQKLDIVDIWNEEFPKDINHSSLDSFENYLSPLANQLHITIENDEGKVLGWYMGFDRDGERWFALLMSFTVQKKGLGTEILNQAKQTEVSLNGWVTQSEKMLMSDGSYYVSPLPFYLKNGFELIPDIILKKMSALKIRWKRK